MNVKMQNTLSLTFNVFLSDGFKAAVKNYYGYESEDEIMDEDIREFIENNIEPATSKTEAFEVEGGDTDGWFVQGFDLN